MLNTYLLTPLNAEKLEQAIPLYGINYNSLKTDGSQGLPDQLIELANMNSFNGGSGEILVSREGALVGLGDGTDPFLIAAASGKLPEGDYFLKSGFDDHDPHLIALGWLLGGYRFDRYKPQDTASARLIAPEQVDVEQVIREASGVGFVRDLVNTPAGDMLPQHLEDITNDLAQLHGATLDVIMGDDLLTKNFPMIHAVGRASISAPRLLDLRWRPKNKATRAGRDLAKITLVGKGVCFDSGGLNIKGGSGMSLMKKDMGGAAHALGLAQMIMQADLPVELRVLICAVENAIDGSAFRPSDILASRKGLTVEIGNTDAEGRLVLADAMAYGAEEEPDFIISLATLTGAARVALGPEVIPFYCDDETLSEGLAYHSKSLFDPAWQMPLWQRYQATLSSSVADMNNISNNSFAGSIVGALFLQRFLPEDMKWMHFDLYAWRPTSEPGRPKGGEAQCVRALYALIKQQFVA